MSSRRLAVRPGPWASLRGVAELSNPGVKYRLNQATGFLAALVERLLADRAVGHDDTFAERLEKVRRRLRAHVDVGQR